MKHTLRTIIWVIAMTLGVCASAQTDTKRAFRMYMHDGSVQFFFYSDIQSMTVGYEDGDMERPVQIINTPDSVYTFAMADIDSVSFVRPVTEYKSNVVRLEDGLLPYVIACDSLTLTFRSDIPRNLLPPVGTHLFTFESNEILPSGFMGELVELREEGSVIAECSGVDITDVFEHLFFAMGEEQPTVPDDEKRRQQWIHDGEIPVRDIGFRLPPNAWDNISAGLGDISGSYGQTAGYNISTSKFHARLFMLCENGEASFSFTSTGKHRLTLDASVAVNAAVNDDLPLITLDIPIPNCPLFDLGFNFGLCYSLGGGFAFDFRSEIPFTSVLHFSGGIKDVGNHWGAAINNIANTGRLIFDSPTTHYIAEGDLTAELGIYGAIDIHPKFWKSKFINDDKRKLAVSAGIRTGWRFSTEMPNFSYVSPVEQANTEFYDELNGKDVYKLQQFLTGYIKLENGFGQNLEYPWDFHVWEPVWSRGIVPEFVNVSLDETGNGGTLSASATLTRKLATYANAGFALYDENKRLVDQWWDSGFYTDREGTTITHDFSNLKKGVNYVVHPLVRSNRAEMVANPSSSNQIEPSIYTQVAKNITQSSATLTALITKMPEDRNFKAGFVYYDTPDNKKTVMVDNNTANVIAEISGLKANTDYSFYAFMQIGDYIENGETKVFKTFGKREDISATSGRLSDVSSSTVMLDLDLEVPKSTEYIAGFYYYEPGGELQVSSSKHVSYGYERWAWVIENLKANTKYYYYGFIQVGNDIAYGDTLSFRTLRADDKENPIFKFEQLDAESYYDGIESKHKLVKADGSNVNGYIIDPKILTVNKNSCGGFLIDELFEGDVWWSYYRESSYSNEVSLDYDNYKVNGEKEAIIRYALPNDKDEWYYTKIPLSVLYEETPKLSIIYSQSGYSTAGLGFDVYINGAIWFLSLEVHAQLWCEEYYKDSDGHRKFRTYKVDEQVFNIMPEGRNAYAFRDHKDGYADGEVILWENPPHSSDLSYHIKILNASATLRNGDTIDVEIITRD